jgi:multidrug resistance efflux pump
LVVARRTALEADQLKRKNLDAEHPEEAARLAEIALENAQTRLTQAVRQLDQFTLRARLPGRVLKVFVGLGESFGPAAREPAILFCPDKPLVVRCEIEQEFAGQVRVGSRAAVLDDVSGERIGEAVVERCSSVFTHRRQPVDDARLHNDFRTMECVLKLLSGAERVRIGQHVRVVIGG